MQLSDFGSLSNDSMSSTQLKQTSEVYDKNMIAFESLSEIPSAMLLRNS